MDLESRAVEGIVCGRRGAVKDEDRQVAEQRIAGIIKSNMLWRESQLVSNTDHGRLLGRSHGRSAILAGLTQLEEAMDGSYRQVKHSIDVSMRLIRLVMTVARAGRSGDEDGTRDEAPQVDIMFFSAAG